MSLRNFISQIKTGGLARTYRYSVILPSNVSTVNNSDVVGLYCDQITLPGVSFSTIPTKTWGESREMPTEKLYDTVTMSVYVDTDMTIRKYFDDWLGLIQNRVDRTFNYYNDYAKQVTIQVDSIADQTKYSIELMECYPKSISSVQLDYAAKDIMKLSITLVYKYWKKTEENLDGGKLPAYIANKKIYPPFAETPGIVTGVTSPPITNTVAESLTRSLLSNNTPTIFKQ